MRLYKDLGLFVHPYHKALQSSLTAMFDELSDPANRTLTAAEKAEKKAIHLERIKTEYLDVSRNRIGIIDKKLADLESSYVRRKNLHYDRSSYQLQRWQSQMKMKSDDELSALFEDYVDSPSTGQKGNKAQPPEYLETILGEMQSRGHKDADPLRASMRDSDYLNAEWKSEPDVKALLIEKEMLGLPWGEYGVALTDGSIEKLRIEEFANELEQEIERDQEAENTSENSFS